jgi:hypothetical protein
MKVRTKQCGISLLAIAPLGLIGTVAKADVVTDWNIKAGNIVVAAKPSPGAPYRTMAIVQSAVYEAVNAITRRYPPDRVKLDAAPGASVEAALAAANRGTLSKLAPSQQATIDDASRAALSSSPMAWRRPKGSQWEREPPPQSYRSVPTMALTRQKDIGRTRPPASTWRPSYRYFPIGRIAGRG